MCARLNQKQHCKVKENLCFRIEIVLRGALTMAASKYWTLWVSRKCTKDGNIKYYLDYFGIFFQISFQRHQKVHVKGFQLKKKKKMSRKNISLNFVISRRLTETLIYNSIFKRHIAKVLNNICIAHFDNQIDHTKGLRTEERRNV